MTRRQRMLGPAAAVAAALALLIPAIARSSDPPHWLSPSGVIDINCSNRCHTLHSAPGGVLTAAAGNVNLCQSCHVAGMMASDLPINNSDRAVAGSRGTSHGFDVAAVNSAYQTTSPTKQAMALRIMNGQVVCSTCHDQHAAASALGGTPRVGTAAKRTSLGSTGALTAGGSYTGTAGLWYLVEIVAAGTETTARFRYSKDGGTSWFPTNCSSGNLAPCLTASNVSAVLDNGVTLRFTNGGGPTQFAANERWELSASWPFLRAGLDAGTNTGGTKFCRDCHAAWAGDHISVRTYDGAVKSHPVGVALNANGQNYDRPVPLDANGLAQTGGADQDGNPSNNLRLDGGGFVQCLSCHAPHFAPSNSAAKAP